ncbi:unnamed protein product [Adineta ricciae]|uniref:Ig-like domain-containing protein n=1 Tax=Adineta ricciae TaxID=249248 RepID=A0A814AAQ9_ADIRI|nr:unnamed protein product [Adineta ricciae]
MLHLLLVFVIITGASCAKIEQIVASAGEAFSFDCQLDESVFFAKQLDNWSEIQENDNKYTSLNLNFNYLTKENVLRVTSNSADSKNLGYYGCRKATWATPNMNRIYKLVIAGNSRLPFSIRSRYAYLFSDVQLFYWSYTCHAPVGSCVRTDDSNDDTSSTFEVADQTTVNLYCCASVNGFKDINVKMNRVGETRGDIHIKRKQELDGSWVVCANQHTLIKRTSSRNPQTLTCELVTDNEPYSTLSSSIVVKNALPTDPDIDSDDRYQPPMKGADDGYFSGTASDRRRGKENALLLFLALFLCSKRRASQKNDFSSIPTNEKNSLPAKQNLKDDSDYLQPTPLYENSSVFLRV